MKAVRAGWLLALLPSVWQPVTAQDGGDSPTLCNANDPYNSTTVPYECEDEAAKFSFPTDIVNSQ